MKRVVLFTLVFAGGMAYATCRYVVFGDVSWANWPSYIVNKALCAALSIAFLLWSSALRKKDDRAAAFWLNACIHCTALHILLSLPLLSPSYYAKFYGPSKMTVLGEFMLLFGVLAAYALSQLGKIRGASARRYVTMGALMGVVLHLMFMGYPGWISPGTWPGGLPPISLLCCGLMTATLILYALVPAAPANGKALETQT